MAQFHRTCPRYSRRSPLEEFNLPATQVFHIYLSTTTAL